MTIGILNPLKSQDIRIVSAPRTDNASVGDCFGNSSTAVRAFRSPGAAAGAFTNNTTMIGGGVSAPPGTAGRTVRRCLFGPTNHGETMDFLNGELATLRERQKRKWDFDFVREKPAETSEKYVWERIEQSEPAPNQAGDNRMLERLDCCHSDVSTVDDNNKMDASDINGLCDKLETANGKCNGRICTKYRQTTINEYWRCSKRSSGCLQCSFNKDCRINDSSRDKKRSIKKETTTSGQALNSDKNLSNSTIVNNNNSSNGSNSIDHSSEDAAVPNKRLCKITC